MSPATLSSKKKGKDGLPSKQAAAASPKQQAQPRPDDKKQPVASSSGRQAAGGGAIQLPGWDPKQVKQAVASLQKWAGEQQAAANALIEEDELFYMLLVLKKMPQGQRKDKLIRIAIPHPLFNTEGAEVCLFVKDQKGEGAKAAKKRLEKFQKRGGVAKIVGLHKLRTKYESHEAKRQLCGAYDFFLADERVLPSLPKLIGKSFFRRRKQPVPIDIRAANFPEQVKAALAATYMAPPQGTSVSVRVGRASMDARQLQANVAAALAGAVARVPQQWANVQAVYLKAAESVALPLWQTLPDAPDGGAADSDKGAAK